MISIDELDRISRRLRMDLVRLSHESGTPHLGSNMSPASILVALFWTVMKIDPKRPDWASRDKFLMSKGHGSAAHYMVLAHRGFFPVEDVFALGQDGSIFEEHAGVNAPPGVEAVTGSLGHGLGIACGMALADRLLGRDNHHFVLMGDGELNEGTVWEAAMFAPAKGLNRVTAIIDYNKWQATGRSNEVLGLAPLRDKFEAFGWNALEIDGMDMAALVEVLQHAKTADRPTAVVCNTVKGAGVSFIEDDNNWHYRIPTEEEVTLALQELNTHA